MTPAAIASSAASNILFDHLAGGVSMGANDPKRTRHEFWP
jgi:hypothetical protein